VAHQPGLFRAPMPRFELSETIRAGLLPLLQRLLQEVVQKADNTGASEIGHDQNHA
jgi:hypothetical protein